jgi:hypothetical protein
MMHFDPQSAPYGALRPLNDYVMAVARTALALPLGAA